MANEREQSHDTLMAIFSEKIDQLIEAVTEIKNNLLTTKDDIRELQLQMRDVENINKQQQKELDENKANAKELKGRFIALAFTVAGTVLAGLIMLAINALI